VSKSKQSRAKSKQSRAKALPWAMMLQAVVVVGRRWVSLSKKDRAQLTRLVRESRGRLGNLSGRERSELRRLVGKFDVNRLGRELLPVLRAGRRGRGRR
jgi:hypothetical protein